MKTLSFDLTDEEHALLTDLATYLDHTPETLLRRSIERLLEEQRAKLFMIEEARRSIDRGEIHAEEEANRLMDAYMDRMDEAHAVAAE